MAHAGPGAYQFQKSLGVSDGPRLRIHDLPAAGFLPKHKEMRSSCHAQLRANGQSLVGSERKLYLVVVLERVYLE